MSKRIKITVLYVGSSLLAPLKQAERDIENRHALGLSVAAHNLGAPLDAGEWRGIERDFSESELVFVFHVTDGENAMRLIELFGKYEMRLRAVVVINCMPELMRRTRMGKLRFGQRNGSDAADAAAEKSVGAASRASRLMKTAATWMGEQVRSARGKKSSGHTQYLRLVERLPALLRFVPNAGRLRDIKHYLQMFCYFLQPTPANIRAMLLYALKHYAEDARLANVETPPPESMPAVAIYHPDAPALFESFAAYQSWYERRRRSSPDAPALVPAQTIGLLLMRPQIVSGTRAHYDFLIRAIEAEGLAVLPAISTFMDNRDACGRFFVAPVNTRGEKNREHNAGRKVDRSVAAESDVDAGDDGMGVRSRVSQIVSLTGFSFVGGPAMNDSEAAVEFLRDLNRPFRSAVSLDVQTVESWQESWTGLNPVQAGMQIAIPEIDGATEPFVYGGMTATGASPVPLEERCRRVARRLRRWNELRTLERARVKVALVVFCFPPNKGNTGTAAELDVFQSVWATLARLAGEGYAVDVPASADVLRKMLTGGNSERYGAACHVAHRMTTDEYRRLCPYVEEIENEWGYAPGAINSFGGELLIQGLTLGNVFIGVQPSFGYEGDPMRLLMARSGAPHHGFAALYTYIEKVFKANVVAHVGTHGALEFMPGKQVGLSGECWPDRLVGEVPHVYIYSVNNPSEGAIARRRSYAELISYLTPPVDDAGVYRDLAALKELLLAYRQATDESEREQLFAAVEESAVKLHFEPTANTERSGARPSGLPVPTRQTEFVQPAG